MDNYPKSISGLLGAWRANPSIGGNVVAWQTQPARAARTAPFPADLHPALAASLRGRGIQQLYSHQVQAWERIKTGQNIVVVTGTASGKTLCYNLPVVDRMLRDPQARALYLFPTKALAQDQQEGLGQLTASLLALAGREGASPADGGL